MLMLLSPFEVESKVEVKVKVKVDKV